MSGEDNYSRQAHASKNAAYQRVQYKVLVVDDDAGIARLHGTFLERHGFAVTLCFDGASALSKFQAAPLDYDLLLTDLRMPKMHGKSLCKAVLQIRDDLPIVVVSGYGIGEVRKELSSLGVYHLLPKPTSMIKLVDTIKKALAANNDASEFSMAGIDHLDAEGIRGDALNKRPLA